MVKFIKGEDKHVRFLVHTISGGAVIVENASYRLERHKEVEASGECIILNDGKNTEIDAKIHPLQIGVYNLEIVYFVGDEILKHREEVQVI